MGQVSIQAGKLLVVTENHGGYLGGKCLWCGASGWMDKLKHTPECPVPDAIASPEMPPDLAQRASCIFCDLGFLTNREGSKHSIEGRIIDCSSVRSTECPLCPGFSAPCGNTNCPQLLTSVPSADAQQPANPQAIADYLYEETTKLDAPISYTACLVLAKHILGVAAGAPEPVDITGWKLVPDDPTEAMWQAGRSADIHLGDSYSKVWRAMFDAAPDVEDCETTSSVSSAMRCSGADDLEHLDGMLDDRERGS